MVLLHNIICCLINTVDKLTSTTCASSAPACINEICDRTILQQMSNRSSRFSDQALYSTLYFDFIFRNQNSDHNRKPKPKFKPTE